MPEPKTTKRGRPAFPENLRRVIIGTSVKPETRDRIKEVAKERGLSLGQVLDAVFAPSVLTPWQPEPKEIGGEP